MNVPADFICRKKNFCSMGHLCWQWISQCWLGVARKTKGNTGKVSHRHVQAFVVVLLTPNSFSVSCITVSRGS